jgi:NTE family protein
MTIKRFIRKMLCCTIACSSMLSPLYMQSTVQNGLQTTINKTSEPDQKLPSPAKPSGRPSVALVLSGGGARGFAHIPVIEMLNKAGIPIDMIIGTSAGSIIGGLYCAGYTTDQLKSLLLSLDWSSIFQDEIFSPFEQRLGEHSLSVTPFAARFGSINGNISLQMGQGFLSGQYTYELFKKLTLKIPSNTDFNTLPIPFRAVTVDLFTGEIHVISGGDLAESIRASISIPAFFQPFYTDGTYYIDGGTRDNTPIDIAKKMGYDIVIVSEISSKLENKIETFEANPLVALEQMINMEQSVRNVSTYYKQADMLLFPDYKNYSILDFDYAQEIYDASKESIIKYQAQIEQLKRRIDSETTGTVTQNRKTSFSGSYNDNQPVIPARVSIEGTEGKDAAFITKKFSGLAGHELTPDIYSAFAKGIYGSGKYTSVITRITRSDKADTMDVIVREKTPEKSLLLLGASYQGTIASDSGNDITLFTDFQLRNLTGTGSVFSLKFSTLTDLGFTMMYMQPIGSKTYVKLDLSATDDRTIISSGFDHYTIDATQLKTEKIQLTFGLPLSNYFTFTTGTGINRIDTTEAIDYGRKTATIDFFTGITFDKLNHRSFPSEGFYLSVDGTGVIPVNDLEEAPVYDVETVDTTIAVPLTNKVSIILGAFTGTNFTGDLQDIPELKPVYGFSLADRRFFPQICTATEYGLNKVAFEMSIQFSPWDQLTILGGKAFFAVTGAAGNIWNSFENIGTDNPCWRSSFDMGIRVTDAFGFLLRTGAGKSRGNTMPFIALDIGNVRL